MTLRKLGIGTLVACSAACGAAPTDEVARPVATTSSSGAPSATDDGCAAAARLATAARDHLSSGRVLGGVVALARAEKLCPTLDGEALADHARAAASIGRCRDLDALAALGHAPGPALTEARAVCARTSAGLGDAAREAQSEALAREGYAALANGDVATAKTRASAALAQAPTAGAALLGARIAAQENRAADATLLRARAFVALEARGAPEVVVVPELVAEARDATLGAAFVFHHGAWIQGKDDPDRVTRAALHDVVGSVARRGADSVALLSNGQVAVAGEEGVSLVDRATGAMKEALGGRRAGLTMLDEGRIAVIGGEGARAGGEVTLLGIGPQGATRIATLEGRVLGGARHGTVFVLEREDQARVVDGRTGKDKLLLGEARAVALSPRGTRVAVCRVSSAPVAPAEQTPSPILEVFDTATGAKTLSMQDFCAANLTFQDERYLLTDQAIDTKSGRAVDPSKLPPLAADAAASNAWPRPALVQPGLERRVYLSGDGRVASADDQLIETATGKSCVGKKKGIVFSPTGPFAATEREVCDVPAGACVPHGCAGPAIFSPDGARLACKQGDRVHAFRLARGPAITEDVSFAETKDLAPTRWLPEGLAAIVVATQPSSVLVDFDKKELRTIAFPRGQLFATNASLSVEMNDPPVVHGRADIPLRDLVSWSGAGMTSPDGRYLGLESKTGQWLFWITSDGAPISRMTSPTLAETSDAPVTLLSGARSKPSQILPSGYVVGALGTRGHHHPDRDAGVWLSPIRDLETVLEARWEAGGGYILETKNGSRALGDARVATLPRTTELACGFGSTVVPWEVCEDAFVDPTLAAVLGGERPADAATAASHP